MKSIPEILEEKISTVMAEVTGQRDCTASVKPATDPKFGDYQVNGVMPLAKQLKTNPRKLAEQIVAELIKTKTSSIEEQVSSIEIAGPGFINLRLKAEFVAESVLEVTTDPENLGIEKTNNPKTIVVDFSGPNIAKQMHVGHLRSTIIGDCICRLLELEGHKVIRQNHIGDWGTQFGMLCAYYIKKMDEAARNGKGIWAEETLADIEGFYREAHHLYETDEEFAKDARAAVVGLHTGNEMWMRYWKIIVSTTSSHFREIYKCLGVILGDEHMCGESFYKDMLANVVGELKKKRLAVESEGAVCVFPPGFKDKEGKPLPVIVQKSDGAFLYATTDLAAIRYRVGELKADKIIYVTDGRQSLHFEMVFAVARMAGWAKPETELIHVIFGSVLGEDGKPLKTRSGENVKLKELLDEAVTRARKIVDEKNPELPDNERARIAQAVGIGAVKYADYTNNRTSDYIFSFNKMLAMEGNTAPYMQYAYARIRSIERKAKEPPRNIDIKAEIAGIKNLCISEPSELDLAKHLIRYGEAVEASLADYRPNYLTSYLYDLAQKFSVFYTNCPVLDAGPDKRPTRLLLCDLTARIIEHGLHDLLGIEVIEQM
jgi:arginyl-tRNA synthetase